jgi:Tfp pilus assembly protein PilO
MPKTFTVAILLILIIQIVFSFFYSSNIITQNNELNQNQKKYDDLKLEVEIVQQQMADLDSIKNISQESSASANLQFIKNTIDLTKP